MASCTIGVLPRTHSIYQNKYRYEHMRERVKQLSVTPPPPFQCSLLCNALRFRDTFSQIKNFLLFAIYSKASGFIAPLRVIIACCIVSLLLQRCLEIGHCLFPLVLAHIFRILTFGKEYVHPFPPTETLWTLLPNRYYY